MSAHSTIPDQIQQRVIRVFVSSTFRDMQAERDELGKFIFPQLRKLCEQRGVTWGEVDLRWGITDEQKAEGKVLPICLEEIRRCRPYFIGLLGERYGWIPDEIPPELVEREPWLVEHRDHSVTELEILHGVLNNPEMAKHAFFYFRDPKYLSTLLPERKSTFLEDASSEETDKYGVEEALRRAEQRKQKLAALKERIRHSGFPVRENYQNPKEFGQTVLQDLTSIIDELYPEGSQPDPLDREAAEHEVFALSRAKVYIGRQTYFDQLDAHARSDGQPLVVLGESGSGKSALLANWAMHYRTEHPDDLVLMHFIGASPGSADWEAMLRRILGEFKRKFNIREELPDRPDALCSTFANWLNMAATQGRVVLILDALNQLDDRDGAPDLVWLPPHIPENVRMFFSTLPGRPLDELKKRGWLTMAIEPLQPEERKLLIKDYLALFSRTLDKVRTERIASAAQCQNPLFLRVLLDELRLFGMHERLGDQIELYLQAPTIPALYELILRRCEQDYERERPGLVRDSTSLLWAARRGLSETELLELLGSDETPLPAAYWSPLHLALEGSLLKRTGLIDFAHTYLRQAVQNRYLSGQEAQRSAHMQLAGYFNGRELNQRKVDELPWQLAEAGAWKQLYDLLTDLDFFDEIWIANEDAVKAYWARLEANSPLRLVEAYRSVFTGSNRQKIYFEDVRHIAFLFADMGHPAEARSFQELLVEHYRQAGDRTKLGDSLGSLANVLSDLGELGKGMTLYQEQEALFRELGDEGRLQTCLGNQALTLKVRGKLDEALALFKEQEHICRVLGDKRGLLSCLGNQALVFEDRGDLDAAMALHKEGEHLCRELGNKAGLSRSLGNQANILSARGDLDGALALNKEDEQLCRELGYKSGLQACLSNQASILADRGDLDGALALHKEAEQICRELGYKDDLQICLGNQALVLKARGDLDGAMTLQKEKERICRELGNKKCLQSCLNNQGNILAIRGELSAAMALYKEAEQICRELGSKPGLLDCMGDQAAIFYIRGELDAAMSMYKEAENIAREVGEKSKLQTCLGSQGTILLDRGELDAAMALYKEAENICRELGYKSGLQCWLGNQANIIGNRGDLDGAMALYREQERLCRELGNKDGLARSLVNQGLLFFYDMKQPARAFPLVDEAYRVAAEGGYTILVRQIEGVRAKIHGRQDSSKL